MHEYFPELGVKLRQGSGSGGGGRPRRLENKSVFSFSGSRRCGGNLILSTANALVASFSQWMTSFSALMVRAAAYLAAVYAATCAASASVCHHCMESLVSFPYGIPYVQGHISFNALE